MYLLDPICPALPDSIPGPHIVSIFCQLIHHCFLRWGKFYKAQVHWGRFISTCQLVTTMQRQTDKTKFMLRVPRTPYSRHHLIPIVHKPQRLHWGKTTQQAWDPFPLTIQLLSEKAIWPLCAQIYTKKTQKLAHLWKITRTHDSMFQIVKVYSKYWFSIKASLSIISSTFKG